MIEVRGLKVVMHCFVYMGVNQDPVKVWYIGESQEPVESIFRNVLL